MALIVSLFFIYLWYTQKEVHMENIFKTYFEKRYLEENSIQSNHPRPVVTISREFGCHSRIIAMMLSDALNRKSKEKRQAKWRFINKEVVEEASRELEINTVEFKALLGAENSGFVKDVLNSFSTHYVTSLKIKKILEKVIRAIAQQGHIVIVGRGSAAILQGVPNVLHVRLQAPIEWRIKGISLTRDVSEEEARKMAIETDKKRTALIELLSGKTLAPHFFDVIYNCSTLSKEEIVQSILMIMESKKMI